MAFLIYCTRQIGVAFRTTSMVHFFIPTFVFRVETRIIEIRPKKSHLNVIFNDRRMAIIVCPGIHSVGAALKSEVSR